MENLIDFDSSTTVVSPFKEMAAYEALWGEEKVNFNSIAKLFASSPFSLPSSHVTDKQIYEYSDLLRRNLKKKNMIKPNLMISNTYDYPTRLRDAKSPVEVLYYSGNIEYLNTKGIAIVGSRKPSENGIRRASKLTRLLVNDGFTIYSGLAGGIDTVAHLTAIENNGRTVAVIGTPLNEFYPKENKNLQLYIAKRHLLISQVPFIKYSLQDFRINRFFFPERNKTMSALAEATVIIEASDTSGTLIQARAALDQGRKLFILQNCFENKNITWPSRFEKQGAIRVREYEDVINNLNM